MRLFEAAGRHLSFKAAAEDLNITPSAISHGVQTLEDWSGVERASGESFRWKGKYSYDLQSRETLATRLGVFADFVPKLPASYADSDFLFLGNIDPELQLAVQEQLAPFGEAVALLQTIPGVGATAAGAIVAEVGSTWAVSPPRSTSPRGRGSGRGRRP